MSYVGLSLIVTILVIVQYAAVYVLLRIVLRSVAYSMVALVAIVLVNFVTAGVRTAWPSTSPLRFGLPYLLPMLVAFRARYPTLG